MPSDHTVTVVFKSGKEMVLPATKAEATTLLGIFSTYLGDPTSGRLMHASYRDGAGSVRFMLDQIAGVASEGR